ncbi:hypothetical protein ACAW74_16045 [Fibrella sp. WM1]|uniref:hypothetical protein n=1 Tax=Fibrella musci TaxID=3242485 RepID=UPI00351FCF2B
MAFDVRFILISLLGIILLNVFSEFTGLEVLSIGFSLYTFLIFVHNVGRTIAIRELMTFVAALQVVLAPSLELADAPNSMAVSSTDYLSYALPAVVAFSVGLNWPLIKTKSHIDLLASVKDYVKGKEKTSFILLILGIIGSFFFNYAPVQIKALVYLFAVCLYASVMYAHYSGSKFKYVTLAIALGLLLYITVRDGMFGHMILWVTLYVLVVLVGTKKGTSLIVKLTLIGSCALFVLLAQSVKMEYRIKTWGDSPENRKGDLNLMVNLFVQRINDPDFLFGKNHLYATYHRLNQGGLIAQTMAYVPHYEPFANGELLAHFIYPFIPRIIWSGKPITGGAANITRFTPLVPDGITSSNISPFGEGYVNFGRIGGVIFLFFFGMLFNYCFLNVIKIAESRPSLLLWIPCLFTGCLSLETDVLSTWGSFVTMSMFLVVFWFVTKRMKLQL